MKKHFILSCLAYLAFGVGFTVQQLGIKAGLGLYPTIIIFISCLLFFMYVVFTSIDKVKRFIKEHDAKEKLTENETL